jgi:DNA-binding protein H-NS
LWKSLRSQKQRCCTTRARPNRRPCPWTLNTGIRHPATGECWDGKGEQRQWLRTALLNQGYAVGQLKPENPLEPAVDAQSEA